ncbi:MAG: trigger factor [Planctomycetaceae bacterium]|jgi:trigger factor|nr:trigger factor [Planctomycetaceae bacterium]
MSENENTDVNVDGAESVETEKRITFQTDIATVSTCERHIKITVGRDEVERYFEKEYDKLGDEAQVPGFRVGKAPRDLVKRRFKKEVAERVKNTIVIDVLNEVNEDKSLVPISEPDITYDEIFLPDTGAFVFEFNLEVRPDFEVPEWRGLKIKKYVHEFSREELDGFVERSLASHAKLQPKDTPAVDGNYVDADIVVSHDGEVLSKFESKQIRVRKELTFHDATVENFGNEMNGVKAGDVRKFDVTLAENAANNELSGKTIEVEFKVNEVKEVVLPESPSEVPEFAKFKDMADLRDAFNDTLKQQLEYAQEQSAREQITEQLTVAANWELPPALLKKQTDREVRRKQMELRREGYPDDFVRMHMNRLRQDASIEVARALKEHFILERIAELENVEVTQDDYDTEVSAIAAQAGVSARRIRSQIEKSGDMDILRNQIVERKVVKMIVGSATFTETDYPINEFNTEALDFPLGGNSIQSATEDDLKAVNKEVVENRMINPSAKVE